MNFIGKNTMETVENRRETGGVVSDLDLEREGVVWTRVLHLSKLKKLKKRKRICLLHLWIFRRRMTRVIFRFDESLSY